MAPHIIVIGASAEGVGALNRIVQDLPRAFDAIVCAVVHTPPWSRHVLPSVLIAGERAAIQPVNHQPLVPGVLYVAPPDHHLLVEDGEAVLWHGPKENSRRPAINALFRSAAIAYGSGAVGVVLSGALDDGATGLWWIKRHGGVAIVQDPNEAELRSMPEAAIATVDVDYCVPAREVGPLLSRLVAADGDSRTQPSEAGGARV
jgi:two-component system chemotaxis response regulator CheB